MPDSGNSTWQDGSGGGTPITAARLNAIETALDVSPKVTYGTTLPASPADGDIHILVDSTTTPTFHWTFRYNSSNTTAYKWEFVGGLPLLFHSAGGSVAAGGTTTWISSTLPVAGVYDFSLGAVFTGGQTSAPVGNIRLSVGGVDRINVSTSGVAGGDMGGGMGHTGTYAAASAVTVRTVHGGSGDSIAASVIRLAVTPMRVSS